MIVKSSENNGINRRILSIFARLKSRPLSHVPFQSNFSPSSLETGIYKTTHVQTKVGDN